MVCKCRQTTLTLLQCLHAITHFFSLHNRLLECDAVSSDIHRRFVNTCCFLHNVREKASLRRYHHGNLILLHFYLMSIIQCLAMVHFQFKTVYKGETLTLKIWHEMSQKSPKHLKNLKIIAFTQYWLDDEIKEYHRYLSCSTESWEWTVVYRVRWS